MIKDIAQGTVRKFGLTDYKVIREAIPGYISEDSVTGFSYIKTAAGIPLYDTDRRAFGYEHNYRMDIILGARSRGKHNLTLATFEKTMKTVESDLQSESDAPLQLDLIVERLKYPKDLHAKNAQILRRREENS